MIEISHIIIIQSLKEGERRTGDEVFQQINFAILKTDFKPNLELFDVHSKIELFNLLNQIASNAKMSSVKPLLHFEMHGRKVGIELSDDTLIEWQELKEPIRRIIIFSGNNLFVGLATCYGAFLLKMYKVWEPCPFYGYIGAETTVGVQDVEISFYGILSSFN